MSNEPFISQKKNNLDIPICDIKLERPSEVQLIKMWLSQILRQPLLKSQNTISDDSSFLTSQNAIINKGQGQQVEKKNSLIAMK